MSPAGPSSFVLLSEEAAPPAKDGELQMKKLVTSAAVVAALFVGSAAPVIAAGDRPTKPDIIIAPYDAETDSVTVRWHPSTDNDGVRGYNVYRNGQFQRSVSGTSWTDRIGNVGDRYHVIAYDDASPTSFSENSIVMVALNGGSAPLDHDGPNHDKPSEADISWGRWDYLRDGTLTFVFGWTEPDDAHGVGGYNIYRNGDFFKSHAYLGMRLDLNEIKPGDKLQVSAWDLHPDTRYGDKSDSFTVPNYPKP